MEKFDITIREVTKCVVSVEAETYEEALKKAEEEYWKNPADYCFDGEDTYFDKEVTAN